jgi:hypothetical protein
VAFLSDVERLGCPRRRRGRRCWPAVRLEAPGSWLLNLSHVDLARVLIG